MYFIKSKNLQNVTNQILSFQRGTSGQTSPNSILNNGNLLTTSEPALVSPSRTPRTADSLSPEERTTLLRSKES